MKQVRICVVTGTRSEFGLLSPLMKEIQLDSAFELQVLVTAMHLSPEFGNTYKDIAESGFPINEKVEMLLSADTSTAIVKSTGLGMIGYADALSRLSPDWVILLGDRFETFAAAVSAYLQKIPIIHLHGGENTFGSTDEGLRHSISKMSYLHFTSTEEYRKRVLQLGESEDRVFNVGAIGLDNVFEMKLLDLTELQEKIDFPISQPYFLVTFHPVTLDTQSSKEQIQALFDAIDQFPEMQVVFTMPNADADGRVIIQMIREYVEQNSGRAKAYTNLGQLRYLSLIKHAAIVLGNSSSGLLEAPSIGVPTVNIGDRQKGRIAPESVIHSETSCQSIVDALKKGLSPDFRKTCISIKSPYGKGGVSKKIVAILKNQKNINLKKEFIDRI